MPAIPNQFYLESRSLPAPSLLIEECGSRLIGCSEPKLGCFKAR